MGSAGNHVNYVNILEGRSFSLNCQSGRLGGSLQYAKCMQESISETWQVPPFKTNESNDDASIPTWRGGVGCIGVQLQRRLK